MTNLLYTALLPQHPLQIDEDLKKNDINGVDDDDDHDEQ